MPNAVEPRSESPRDLATALDLLADADGPAWRPIAGGTDLMVQVTGEIGEPPERVVDIWQLDELRGIVMDSDVLQIGALTTYTELRRSPVVTDAVPVLAEAAATIGAGQIQNRGTIGGNVINASPAGDTLPVLLALDATMVLRSASGMREIAATEFWPSYRATARAPDELLTHIRIPLPADRQVRFRKVGTRRAQAISKVVMALAWQSVGDAPWGQVRLALGSVAATTVRSAATEAVLEGQRPSRQTADAAVAALTSELKPIDDVRSSAAYRLAVSGRILRRMLRDEGGW